jgi:hypothetical protein
MRIQLNKAALIAFYLINLAVVATAQSEVLSGDVKIIRKGQAATAAGQPHAYALDHYERLRILIAVMESKRGIIRRVKYW